MNKNMKMVAITAMVVLVALVSLWVVRDLFLVASNEIRCDDGLRRTIDLRDFTMRYWAYAVEFEATMQDIGKLQGKLEPQRLQELTAAQQQAQEFHKFVVAGFNSCAISKSQYAEYGARFQALDAVGRRIDNLLGHPILNAGERKLLDDLVGRYTAMTQQLAEAKA